LNPDSEGDADLLAAIGETLRRPGDSRPDVLADKLVEFGPRLAGTLTRAAYAVCQRSTSARACVLAMAARLILAQRLEAAVSMLQQTCPW
jgi:hypothetical protein